MVFGERRDEGTKTLDWFHLEEETPTPLGLHRTDDVPSLRHPPQDTPMDDGGGTGKDETPPEGVQRTHSTPTTSNTRGSGTTPPGLRGVRQTTGTGDGGKESPRKSLRTT